MYNVIRYILTHMIKSFCCKHTQALFEGRSPRPFRGIKAAAERKLQLLDSATCLDFLRSPPGNRLEALDGNRAGQHSIRINKQWRLCFVWSDSGIYDVEIVDYH
jgi:proteic killer suppression protein